eukprot:648682-Amphidinium_carterae.1
MLCQQGEKHFALLPPNDPAVPLIDEAIANLSQLHWYREEMPRLLASGHLQNLYQCTIKPGDWEQGPIPQRSSTSPDMIALRGTRNKNSRLHHEALPWVPTQSCQNRCGTNPAPLQNPTPRSVDIACMQIGGWKMNVAKSLHIKSSAKALEARP